MIELYVNEKMDFFDKKDDPFQSYLITNFGRVYSLKTRKFLKPQPNNCGYLRVDIRYFNKDKTEKYRKMVFIHIEVVKVFGDCLGQKFDKRVKNIDILEIDHLDKNLNHCSFDNLEIVTRKENIRRRDMSDDERKHFIKNRYTPDINLEDIF